MKWKPFTHQGQVYNLTHLHPFEHAFTRAEKDEKPAEIFNFEFMFGLHTFTRGSKDGQPIPLELRYRDSRETREFCFTRYELSKQLPDIVRALDTHRCFHTRHGNFFIIERVTREGKIVHYEVYFDIKREKGGGYDVLYSQRVPEGRTTIATQIKKSANRVFRYRTQPAHRKTNQNSQAIKKRPKGALLLTNWAS
ncbi:MAG: hypothetical protein GXP23_02765 [Gammaproteobacteria bacterium]|nr:hypothetical protein [Gammaproteobacteria bacterium]